MGCGEFQPRLFGNHLVVLQDKNCNANSATLCKGTIHNKLVDKENKQLAPATTTSISSFSFDLVLDDNQNEREVNVPLQDEWIVGEDSDSDESDISSIGMPIEFIRNTPKAVPSSRLLLAASFPSSPSAASLHTMTPAKDGGTPKPERTRLSTWSTSASTFSNAGTTLARARSLTALGHGHLQQKDYPQARLVLNEACQLYESIYGPNHTSVAMALDTYALACPNDDALSPLQRAWQIRSHHLGVWHVDTVDTYNKIAFCHERKGDYPKALATYQEVLRVRKAIWGPHHPSVAITAHALAKIHAQLGHSRESQTYFQMAKEIYTQLGMRYSHKAMASLVQDELEAKGAEF